MIRNIPDIYSKDWFSNRSETGKYLFDKSGSIYDFSNKTVAEILYGSEFRELYENPRKLEKECEALNLLINKNKPASVTIHNKKNLATYTNGKEIVISGKPLKEQHENGIDIILGLLTHESSHIRFTDFFYTKEKALRNKSLKWLWNMIEDEIIEEMVQIEKPGLGNLLGAVKDYMFGDNSEKSPVFKSDLDAIMYILFSLIRYPINLNNVPVEILEEYEELFKEIFIILKLNNVLNISVKENCTKENYTAACEIFELLKKYIKNQKISGSNGSKSGKNSEEGSDNDSEDEEESEEAEKTEDLSGEVEEMSDEEAEQILNEVIDEDDEAGNSPFDNIISTKLGESIPESISENKVNENINQLSKCPIEVDDYMPDDTPFKEDYSRGLSPTKTLKKLSKTAVKLNTDKYKQFVNEVKPYIKLIEKIQLRQLTKESFLEKEAFKRNGSLDPRLLASAMQNIQNVYQRYGIKYNKTKANKFTVVLTLDESGSIASKSSRELVTKLAISIVEAFKNNPNIDVYVYGHSDYVTKYINPKMKFYDVLLNRYQGMGQNEVKAYNTILNDVTKEVEDYILLINITDAQYLANYSEIEDELAKWDKHIYQSLIVINNYLTTGDRMLNDKIYGKDNWAQITSLKNYDNASVELKKIVKYINSLYDKINR